MRRTVRDTIISSQPTIGPIRADFEQRFRAAYGEAPDDYRAAAYACTEVILQAMQEAVKTASNPAELRDAIREYAGRCDRRWNGS